MKHKTPKSKQAEWERGWTMKASGDRPTRWPAPEDLHRAFETPRLLTITQDSISTLVFGNYEEEEY